MTAVVLIGGSGWLGGHLRAEFPDAEIVSATEALASDGLAVLRQMTADRQVIVNAAGALSGNADTMMQLNSALPGILARAAENVGGHVVHLGSAAEYGMTQPGGWCDEDATAHPTSDYGRTKLEGTVKALNYGHTTVLRVFNVAGCPPQVGSPLEDIAQRLRIAVERGSDVELLSAGTVRDWVTPTFICASVAAAANGRIRGLFNVASGVGVRMGDAVETAIKMIRVQARTIDLARVAASTVVGNPERWRAASGLADVVTTEQLARILLASAQ